MSPYPPVDERPALLTPDEYMTRMSAETLASFVILGHVDDRPTDVCGAWIDSADRTCGKPAAEPWLCRRHVTVATKRADAYIAREAARRERADARRLERAPRLRARLATVEARIRQLDPPSRGDGAVVNVPLARRMPTDNQIAELARLVHERDRLRAEVGA